MTNRTPLSLALVLALNLMPQPARADEAAPKAKAKAEAGPKAGGGSAKQGEACKVDADCDQSGSRMICGKGKCEYDLSKSPVKT